MTPDLLKLLRTRVVKVSQRWEELLRREPVSGPLANPDSLVHLIPESTRQILSSLGKAGDARGAESPEEVRLPGCECGKNPFLAYFVAGERAFTEEAKSAQSGQAAVQCSAADLRETANVVRRLACAEIDNFCGICVHRAKVPHCRHASAVN